MSKFLVMSICLFSLVGCSNSFDKQQWLNNKEDRYEMAKSLVKKENLCSYTPEQIVEQLGKPTKSYRVMGPVMDMDYLVLDKTTPDVRIL